VAFQTPVTAADRVVTALISAVAAFGTATVLGVVLMLHFGDALTTEFWRAFLYFGGGFIVVAAVLGFVVGPVRAAEYWGLVWGTEDAEKHRGPVILISVLVIFFCAMVLLWQK
jgi:hypothetical protein